MKVQHNPYRYRRCLPHIQDSVPLFIRFNTHDRWELPGAARSLVMESCLYEHERRVRMHAVVVMPEHVHLLLSLNYSTEHVPPPLYRILKNIKSASAHSINHLLGRTGRVWQEESFDRATRANEFQHCVDYIRQNPVKRGLVSTPEEYPWLWCNVQHI